MTAHRFFCLTFPSLSFSQIIELGILSDGILSSKVKGLEKGWDTGSRKFLNKQTNLNIFELYAVF